MAQGFQWEGAGLLASLSNTINGIYCFLSLWHTLSPVLCALTHLIFRKVGRYHLASEGTQGGRLAQQASSHLATLPLQEQKEAGLAEG